MSSRARARATPPAEAAPDKLHGVSAFDVVSGTQFKPKANAPAYTKVFGESLVREARKDERIVAVTAAMPAGTGLDIFAKQFPKRAFDVGIAEQHAVTFSAGLAAEGFKPFCAIYSTFLQRAYDQIVHDVALQKLPVRFAIDRAGLVGADGPTHAGAFDLAYLGCVPNMVLMAPSDEAELVHMVATAAAYRRRSDRVSLSARRRARRGASRMWTAARDRAGADHARGLARCAALPRNETVGMPQGGGGADEPGPVDDGRRRALRQAPRRSAHRPARRKEHEVLLTIEEGSSGGFGSLVLAHLAEAGALDQRPARSRR